MKLSLCLATLSLAGALGHSAPFLGRAGRTPLALVVKGDTYATGDGGWGSATFRGKSPKGGTQLKDAVNGFLDFFKSDESTDKTSKAADKGSKEASNASDKVSKVSSGGSVDESGFNVGSFWESKIFREGGLGFVFGVGAAVALKKCGQEYAWAVCGTCAVAQYLSRSDYLNCGGRLGWPKLDAHELRPALREHAPFVWRSMRIFKHTVMKAGPTACGFAAGFYGGLKAKI